MPREDQKVRKFPSFTPIILVKCEVQGPLNLSLDVLSKEKCSKCPPCFRGFGLLCKY